MERCKDKVALVTGASRGIGRGIAIGLASEGAHIVVNYNTHRQEAEEVARDIRAKDCQALVCQADVADRHAVSQMISDTVERFGHLDIAVANAAFSIRMPVIEYQWADFARTIEVCQYGVFHTCQLSARQMVHQSQSGRPGGKIVIISSVMEEICFPNSAPYTMSKAAINRLGQTMAGELASHRINVNIVNPGWIDTPGELRYHSEQQLRERGKDIPWGRMGTAEDIANAVVFLVSDEADYVTGATLRVDGGYLLGLSLTKREQP